MILWASISRLGRPAATIALLTATLAIGGGPTPDDGHPHVDAHRVAMHRPMRPMKDNTNTMMRGAHHEAETTNWSGYFVAKYQTGQTYRSASATWTIPSVTSGGNSGTSYSATWVGIGGTCTNPACTTGSTDQTLIQLGTEQDALGFNGTNYYAWYELIQSGPAGNSVQLPNAVFPGDRMSASLACTASCNAATQSWTLSMTDYTQGWTWTQTFSYASSELSAEWIEEATSLCDNNGSNCTVEPLADYETMTLNPGTANGTNPFMSLANNGIELIEDKSPQTSQPSETSAGNGFTTCWGDHSVTPCSFVNGGTPLVAAVLPSSRSIETGTTATAFATVINSGSSTATGCGIALGTNIDGTLSYQTTSSTTNALTGTANTPVNIPANGTQSFLVSLTPGTTFNATATDLQFNCANVNMAQIEPGLDTLLLSSSATPTPDVIALSATPSGDGIVDIHGTSGTAAFAVATVNVGASSGGNMMVDVYSSASLPLGFTICQTNPSTGQCLFMPTQGGLSVNIPANSTPTFSVFVTASGAVAFDPANNRIILEISDGGGNVRGSTSVAVRTQ